MPKKKLSITKFVTFCLSTHLLFYLDNEILFQTDTLTFLVNPKISCICYVNLLLYEYYKSSLYIPTFPQKEKFILMSGTVNRKRKLSKIIFMYCTVEINFGWGFVRLISCILPLNAISFYTYLFLLFMFM